MEIKLNENNTSLINQEKQSIKFNSRIKDLSSKLESFSKENSKIIGRVFNNQF